MRPLNLKIVPVLAVVIFIFISVVFAAKALSEYPSQTITIPQDYVKVHSGPGSNYEVLGSCHKGWSVGFLEKRGKWIKIEALWGNLVGWINEEALSVEVTAKEKGYSEKDSKLLSIRNNRYKAKVIWYEFLGGEDVVITDLNDRVIWALARELGLSATSKRYSIDDCQGGTDNGIIAVSLLGTETGFLIKFDGYKGEVLTITPETKKNFESNLEVKASYIIPQILKETGLSQQEFQQRLESKDLFLLYKLLKSTQSTKLPQGPTGPFYVKSFSVAGREITLSITEYAGLGQNVVVLFPSQKKMKKIWSLRKALKEYGCRGIEQEYYEFSVQNIFNARFDEIEFRLKFFFDSSKKVIVSQSNSKETKFIFFIVTDHDVKITKVTKSIPIFRKHRSQQPRSEIPEWYYKTNNFHEKWPSVYRFFALGEEGGFLMPYTYKLNTFDCSEMAAYTEWALEDAGFDAYICEGWAPFDLSGYHAWILVRDKNGKWQPIEATMLLSKEDNLFQSMNKLFAGVISMGGYVKPDCSFYEHFFNFEYCWGSISNIPSGKLDQYDWWNELEARGGKIITIIP